MHNSHFVFFVVGSSCDILQVELLGLSALVFDWQSLKTMTAKNKMKSEAQSFQY